jgi:DNA end-binding protein Ku
VAQRPIWRGQLRLALVSCPVALYAAHHDRGSLHFNLINPATGHRIRMISEDAETGEPVARRDLVKGYEFKKDHYLIMSDEDFESARVESSTTLTIDKFVDASSIDPVHYESSYYLAPDGKDGRDVYVVLRDAIGSTGRVALSRVTIAGRERAIAIMPMDPGLIAHTLNEARDLNDAKPLFEDVEGIKSDPEMVKLAKQLIDRQTGKYDPADVEDRYETRLREVIEAKLKGEGIEPVEEEPDRSNVIDLMAALRQSLAKGAQKDSPQKGDPRKGNPGKAENAKPPPRRAKPAGKPKSSASRTAPRKPTRKHG